jgi:tripeptidyl-peptidase-1
MGPIARMPRSKKHFTIAFSLLPFLLARSYTLPPTLSRLPFSLYRNKLLSSWSGETGDDKNIDPIYSPAKHMCGKYTPTNVISLSYGDVEADLPTYYQIRQCNEFMKLGLQGVTIVFASGDAGVSDRNFRCPSPEQKIFNPDYPDCPYVTMVGATTLPSRSNAGDPETAVTTFFSGGGFSNIYAQPSYQQTAIDSWVHEFNFLKTYTNHFS